MKVNRKNKPGVKFYIDRYRRIENGLTGHWLFSTFTAVFISCRVMSIGPAALCLVVPPLVVSAVLAVKRGEFFKHITADGAVIMLNTIMIPGVLKDLVETESMYVLGVITGIMIIPSMIYCYYKDLGGA